MGDEERPLFSFEERLPEGKVIHRRVEPPGAGLEWAGRTMRELMEANPGHDVYVRFVSEDDRRIEMVVVEGAIRADSA